MAQARRKSQGTEADEATKKDRRDPGTGSIVEVADGVFRVRAYVGRDPLTGKKKQVERQVRGTKSQATAAWKKLDREIEEGKHSGQPSTLKALVLEYRRHSEGRHRSENHLHGLKRLAEDVLPADIGAIPIAKLTALHLDELYRRMSMGEIDGMAKQGASSVQRYHADLNAALEQAVRWQWLRVNPAVGATLPEAEVKKLPVLKRDQVRSLLVFVTDWGENYGMLLLLAVLTASRLGEFCAIRWSRIDWEEGEINIQEALFRTPEKRGVKSTKGRRARSLPIDPLTAGVLIWWRARCEETAERYGVTLHPDAFIVSPDPTGIRPMNPNTFSTTVSRIAKKNLGIRMGDYGRNPFRHVGGTKILRETSDSRSGADILGHADPAFFIRRYTHGTTEGGIAAAAALASTAPSIVDAEAGTLSGLLGLTLPTPE